MDSGADFATGLAAVKDFLVAIAAIVTAVVAIVGLTKWREELRGKADFEVARALIRATYKMRDYIGSARAHLTSSAEFPAGYDSSTANATKRAEAWQHFFWNRWKHVAEALREVEAEALEAEALWGPEIREPILRVRRCAHTLFVAMQTMIENEASGNEHFEHDRDFGVRTRSTAFGSMDDDKNQFSRELAGAVTALEAAVRPHMKR
jgi:hypothetical protein